MEKKMEIEGACVVCMTMPKSTILLDCKHIVMCANCARQSIVKEIMTCPSCRCKIERGAVVIGTKFFT